MRRIDRREFLGASGVALLGAAAVACSGGDTTPLASATSIDGILAGRRLTMAVIAGLTEALARPNERIPLILGKPPGAEEQHRGGSGRMWAAESRTAQALGPYPVTWHDEGLEGKGVYSARVSIPRDGAWNVLVEATPEGAGEPLVGGAQLTVGRQSAQPIPGERAVSTPSPTTANPRGVDPICTRRPICPLHAISLDEALRSGKPTVLNIGTPAFCEVRFCGPVLEAVIAAQRTVGAAVSFVHVEVYKDDREAPARAILSPAAAAWKLEVEPVTYFIGSDGIVADRFVSLADAAEIAAAARALR